MVLDVPNLSVGEINLEVQNLRARIDLDARIGSLVTLQAGVDLGAERVSLQIKDVQATLTLRVDLDNVVTIVDRTLDSVDQNPELITGLLNAVSGVLTQTVNTLGQTVQRTVDATGNIVERTVDQVGNVVGPNVVGNIAGLPVQSTTTNAAGQTVRRVTDPAGAVIEVVLNSAGQVLSTRVVSQATGSGR